MYKRHIQQDKNTTYEKGVGYIRSCGYNNLQFKFDAGQRWREVMILPSAPLPNTKPTCF